MGGIIAHTDRSHLFYFLLHIPQLTLPLPPLHIEPLQQLSFLPRPVSFAELQATVQVHSFGASVLQEPPLLFPLPAERRGLPELLPCTRCQLASPNNQPSALPRFQLESKRRRQRGRAFRWERVKDSEQQKALCGHEG